MPEISAGHCSQVQHAMGAERVAKAIKPKGPDPLSMGWPMGCEFAAAVEHLHREAGDGLRHGEACDRCSVMAAQDTVT